jgi:PAS domain S-box-containing protein
MNDEQGPASLGPEICWDTLDHLKALVRVWTPQDGCLYVNQVWRDLTGQTPQECRGAGWLDQVVPDDRPAVVDALAAAVETQRSFTSEYRVLTHQGGSPLAVRDWGQPWVEEDGHLIGFVHTCLPRQIMQEPATEAQESYSSWAHELRGPLNAIVGWADLLASGAHPPDIVARGLKAIATNARQQAAILRRMAQAGGG